MKSNETYQQEANSYLGSCQRLLKRLENAKAAIVAEFREKLAEHQHLVELAVNEAEALAWQTDFPELLFPLLAVEKVSAVAAWNHKQQRLRRSITALAVAA